MFQQVYKGDPEGRIVIEGFGSLEQVTIEEVPSTLSLTADQTRLLPAIVNEVRAAGRVLTDDPIYRLESWEVGPSLHLKLSRRSYFDSVLLKRYPEWGVRSRVLAVACLLHCSDGYAIEKRSEKVAAKPGMMHLCPAGSLQPPDSPLKTLYREAEEELGLAPSDLNEVSVLGLVYGEEVGVFQLICRASVEFLVGELASRECSGSWERETLVAAPTEAEEFKRWIVDRREKLTEAGYSALVMEGRRRWSDDWVGGLL